MSWISTRALRRIHKKLASSSIFWSILLLSAPVWAIGMMTLDQDEDYSEAILDKISTKWKAPPQLKGNYRLKLLLKIDGEGRITQCVPRTKSGLDALEAAACSAARSAAPFGRPPKGEPKDLYLSLWLDQAGAIPPEPIKMPVTASAEMALAESRAAYERARAMAEKAGMVGAKDPKKAGNTPLPPFGASSRKIRDKARAKKTQTGQTTVDQTPILIASMPERPKTAAVPDLSYNIDAPAAGAPYLKSAAPTQTLSAYEPARLPETPEAPADPGGEPEMPAAPLAKVEPGESPAQAEKAGGALAEAPVQEKPSKSAGLGANMWPPLAASRNAASRQSLSAYEPSKTSGRGAPAGSGAGGPAAAEAPKTAGPYLTEEAIQEKLPPAERQQEAPAREVPEPLEPPAPMENVLAAAESPADSAAQKPAQPVARLAEKPEATSEPASPGADLEISDGPAIEMADLQPEITEPEQPGVAAEAVNTSEVFPSGAGASRLEDYARLRSLEAMTNPPAKGSDIVLAKKRAETTPPANAKDQKKAPGATGARVVKNGLVLPRSPNSPIPPQKTLGSETFDKYVTRVVWHLRQAMYVPIQTKPGTYFATVRIKINKQGKLLSSRLLSPSKDPLLDKYVLQGIKRAGKVPPPPQGIADTLDLTFKLVRTNKNQPAANRDASPAKP